MKPKRIEILGIPVDCVTMEQAIEWAESKLQGNHPCTILAVNPEKVMRAQHDPELLGQLRSADLLIPDGIGVVLAARLLGLGHAARVPGAELMPKLCERAALKGYSVFLLGATPEVNQQAVAVLRDRYPGIRIVGSQHGYVKEEDMPAVITRMNECKPDFLFVALGSPHQELWMSRYLPQLKVKVCQGVGGTFDVIAGRVRRAPKLFRFMHLEWFYRLASNPRRARRQTALPKFAYHVLKSLFIK
ncbi:MAG: WecB/TagA/CpsF family glycosyltransferase [Nitrospira sp.]|nr:WecB/TagA/CpsF family glycosyltransferase [Nitrospira sp.]